MLSFLSLTQISAELPNLVPTATDEAQAIQISAYIAPSRNISILLPCARDNRPLVALNLFIVGVITPTDTFNFAEIHFAVRHHGKVFDNVKFSGNRNVVKFLLHLSDNFPGIYFAGGKGCHDIGSSGRIWHINHTAGCIFFYITFFGCFPPLSNTSLTD